MTTSSKFLSIAILSIGVCSGFAANAWAQAGGFGGTAVTRFQRANSSAQYSATATRNRVLQSSVGQVGVAGVNRRSFLSTDKTLLTQKSKPFSSVSRSPSVSPYLALSAPLATATDYYNVVRPQQQQRDQQRQTSYSIQRTHKLNQMAARGPYSTTGDQNSAPTGHAAVFQSLGSFQNTGNYFPPPSRPKQQRR